MNPAALFRLPTHLAPPSRALVGMAALAIVLFYTFAVGQRLLHTIELQRQAAVLEMERQALEARRAALEAERARLIDGTDVEMIARRELNLIKPGETAVVVIPSPSAKAAAPPAEPAPAPQQPFWETLWRGLFGG